MDNTNLINKNKTLLDALKVINSIEDGPLVLFALNDNNQMVGTLTDGDIRRALISGYSINDNVSKACNKNFNYLKYKETDTVENIRHQKDLKMKLVPILDSDNHIIQIVNLEKFKSQLPVDAILMAGGKGLRLRPLTETTPKPLLKVGDKAIIDHNIDRLMDYGIKNISVTVNYLAEQLENHYSDLHKGLKINCVHEPRFLGTFGSVQFVRRIINDTVLVMNSDLLTNIDYEDFYLHFKHNDADMSVAAIPYTVSVPFGIFELDGRNIRGIKEKPAYNYFANAGIYLIKKSILNLIPSNKFFNATDFIEKLINLNKSVIRYPITGFWIDIGSKDEYEKAIEMQKHL